MKLSELSFELNDTQITKLTIENIKDEKKVWMIPNEMAF